jgi:signal transduction histidine kinase
MAANLSVSLQGLSGMDCPLASAAFQDAQSLTTNNWLMLAHDLRNPLIAVQRVLEIALTDSRSDKTQDLLAQAHTNCDLLLNMLTDVLDSHRPSSFKEKTAEPEASPRAIIDDCIQLMQTLADEKNISFRTQAPSGPVTVLANPRSIIRVLANLVHNAVKFSNPGGRIDITAEAVTDDCLIFSVKDQGSGIPPQEAEKIFDMQYQCEPLQHPQTSGYGWGLYYCKTTLAALGCDIWVEPGSKMAGEGTVISFTVPSGRVARPGGAKPCHYPAYPSA